LCQKSETRLSSSSETSGRTYSMAVAQEDWFGRTRKSQRIRERDSRNQQWSFVTVCGDYGSAPESGETISEIVENEHSHAG
jgi:hypothetical protein